MIYGVIVRSSLSNCIILVEGDAMDDAIKRVVDGYSVNDSVSFEILPLQFIIAKKGRTSDVQRLILSGLERT